MKDFFTVPAKEYIQPYMLSPTIRGTLFLADELNFVKAILSDPYSTTLIFSLDEVDHSLEKDYYRAIQATVLLPPPSAIFAEIDGDSEKFVTEYREYLSSIVPTDFIVTILKLLHDGIDGILYIPSFNEESVWVNVLLSYLFETYGIKLGTSSTDGFLFDRRYKFKIAEDLFMRNYITALEYVAETYGNTYHTYIPETLVDKVYYEIRQFIPPGMPLEKYCDWYVESMIQSQTGFLPMPAVTFEQGV